MGVIRSVSLEGQHCTLTIRRPAPGVVAVAITGSDVGELGDAPFRELADDVARGGLRLFIDARSSQGATIEVSGEWAAWLLKHRDRFGEVRMLVGSRLVEVTANLVKRFSALEGRMEVVTDPAAFDEALRRAVGTRGVA